MFSIWKIMSDGVDRSQKHGGDFVTGSALFIALRSGARQRDRRGAAFPQP
jgi:hypothetical protein